MAKNVATFAPMALAAFLFTASGAGAQQQTWTLDNGSVERTLFYNSQVGLTTSAWRDLETGTNFVTSSKERESTCREFRVKSDDVMVTASAADLRLVGNPQVRRDGSGARLDLTLSARKAPLRIVVHYQAPANFAAIRQWLTIENTGEKPVMLRDLTISCQELHPGPGHDEIVFGHYGEDPHEVLFTGRVNDVAVLLESSRTGEGLAVLNEAPGNLRRTEISWDPVFGEPNVQAMYDTDLFPFERRLEPGEKYETAAASIVFYRRNTKEDPHWVLPEYVEQAIAHNKNQQPPYWMYNDWQPWENMNATSAILKDVIPRATAMGFNLIALDAGWAKVWGDDALNPENFPDGLGVLFPSAPKHSFARGLWFPVALVSKQSTAYREHPEWACHSQNGRVKESQGEGVVMCLASPYKQFVLNTISQAVHDYRLTYVKLDLTTLFNAYGEEPPGCYETGHEHASAAESNVRIYEALGWIADQLHQQYPGLLIDFTFELWGEKQLIDYGLLHVADLDWVSNVPDRNLNAVGPLQARTILYQRGMAISTEDMLVGALQIETPSWQERVATAMASAPVLLGDTRKVSDEEIQQISQWIAKFKKLREEVPLNESFFPLGSWRQPRITAWDGYGRFARSGEGLIAVFGNESQDPSARIAIPGYPDGHFRATDWSTGMRFDLEGSQLRGGWILPLTGKPRVRVLEVRRR